MIVIYVHIWLWGKMMTNKPSCTNCPNMADFAGNYVECVKLHRFVDWWWWRDQAPEDCPKREKENG